MDTTLQILLLILGFAFLIKGADWLIMGASSTASNFKVSKMLIGLTIVAFGTGAPEFAVSISSLLSGKSDLLFGNVVGSNILNILLLVGIGALIRPIRVKKNTVRKELPLLLLISTVIVVLFFSVNLAGVNTSNIITRSDGIICLLLFGIFLYYIIAMAHKDHASNKEVEKPQWNVGRSLTITGIGLVGVVLGSQLVVNSASTIAAAAGVSERVIALTIVAFGTSLPELVTTITAAKRGENELIIGNIIGSNIFNICIVLGLPVAIFGTITPSMEGIGLYVDLGVMLLASILLWVFTLKDRKVTRLEGAIMLLVFVAYYSYVAYGVLA
jgi:cation:H+ antiporter